MTPRISPRITPELIVLAVLVLFPFIPLPGAIRGPAETFGSQLTTIFILALLALGLNVVVGYTGLLHLGIAAFFGIGAYITGILTAAPTYPFQIGFVPAVILSMLGAAAAGLILGAPTLRLRGDYLALVTLAFGEVVRFSLRNLEEITNGTRALDPIPPPQLPAFLGWQPDWQDFRPFYFLTLGVLVVVIRLLKNLEASRIGRDWVAVREDELASTCMGINASRVKLSAFAVGAALAGLAGSLYATKQGGTTQPDSFDFNRSIMMLCGIILGGLGSLRGTLLGAFLLIGFDNILAPMIDGTIQRYAPHAGDNVFLTFSNWRLMIFGLALILMMRFRPEGLLPAERTLLEIGEEKRKAGKKLRKGTA